MANKLEKGAVPVSELRGTDQVPDGNKISLPRIPDQVVPYMGSYPGVP